MYTMDNCPLCAKAKNLLEIWGFKYYSINVKPYAIRSYPFFVIGNTMYDYTEIVDMIAKDELQPLLDYSETINEEYSCDCFLGRARHACGRKPYCEVYIAGTHSWSYLCRWHYIVDRLLCLLRRRKNHGYYILDGDEE